ncbi:DNA methyltransferase [Emticicia sp. CRIBPO]|uniref:DNA methyltransferase n=1 Tax=Emticicia sp. CRIBPO TaxID=2683258 RepID=UPI001412F67D|nr:DNA methyltransferase [Emticicia sp. CRIBPO]NBA84987.1 DNA methyltransferase [Emticicia sp. CRIBPO]
MKLVVSEPDYKNSVINKLNKSDREFHDWYRFVLSYPPHLVNKYIEEFQLTSNDILLDPFCGAGTTVLQSKLNGIPSIGIEANSFAHFASSVKVNWKVNAIELRRISLNIKKLALVDNSPELKTLSTEHTKLILKDSISPIPLHKSLVLLGLIDQYKNTNYYKYLALAFGNAVVYKISNLRFGPEVGVGKIKVDVDAIGAWYEEITKICDDLELVKDKKYPYSEVIFSDSRNVKSILKEKKVSAVITSPPYPNEKDYTRTTRLESVLLGFINSREDLRKLKKTLLRSNTKGVYKGDNDDEFVINFPEIQRIAKEIEDRRIELNKTSGFEKLYSKVTKLYFGGMAKHLEELKSVLKPGAHLAYVVGDQASFLRVMIPTGKLLGEIAVSLGYELVRIDLFRTRFSTATKSDLNEEVVILKWNGKN